MCMVTYMCSVSRRISIQDMVQGGAWPFLVRGVICLVNSDNERDSSVAISLGYNIVISKCMDGLTRKKLFEREQ